MIGPDISPAPTTEPVVPRAWPRSSGGNASVTIAFPFAIASETPIAWKNRNAISCSMFWAKLAIAIPSVKITHPVMYTRFRPYRSPTRPAVSVSPVTTRLEISVAHTTVSGERSNSRESVGSATFTMLKSMVAMKVPNATAIRQRHL